MKFCTSTLHPTEAAFELSSSLIVTPWELGCLPPRACRQADPAREQRENRREYRFTPSYQPVSAV